MSLSNSIVNINVESSSYFVGVAIALANDEWLPLSSTAKFDFFRALGVKFEKLKYLLSILRSDNNVD